MLDVDVAIGSLVYDVYCDAKALLNLEGADATFRRLTSSALLPALYRNAICTHVYCKLRLQALCTVDCHAQKRTHLQVRNVVASVLCDGRDDAGSWSP